MTSSCFIVITFNILC